MKNLIIVIIVSFFSINNNAQNDSIPNSRNYEQSDMFGDYWKIVTFKIGGGAYIAQGNLNSFFDISPFFELSLDFPVTDTKSLELGLQFVIPNQKEPFQFTQNTGEAEATLIFNPMLRFKKNFSTSQKSKFLASFGVGASIIGLNQTIVPNSEEEKTEIVAFLVSPSLDYIMSFNKKEQLTFGIGINYSPYKMKGAINQDIGSVALTPKILYSF